jgi:aspartate/tyrosine/aromatic aminotransferase
LQEYLYGLYKLALKILDSCEGARIIAEVLKDKSLKSAWELECAGMAQRIQNMRDLLRKEIEKTDTNNDWSHVTKQIGMFCYTGLNPQQVRLFLRRIFFLSNMPLPVAFCIPHL